MLQSWSTKGKLVGKQVGQVRQDDQDDQDCQACKTAGNRAFDQDCQDFQIVPQKNRSKLPAQGTSASSYVTPIRKRPHFEAAVSFSGIRSQESIQDTQRLKKGFFKAFDGIYRV